MFEYWFGLIENVYLPFMFEWAKLPANDCFQQVEAFVILSISAKRVKNPRKHQRV
jgi:hypothetical protein